jgi:hypothetical protein
LAEAGSQGLRAGRDDPIIIGGVGGSGTRVVTAVLETCGMHIPGPTNSERDSVWPMMIFARPAWLSAIAHGRRPSAGLVEAACTLRAMFNGVQLSRSRLEALAAAAADEAAMVCDGDVRIWRSIPATPFQLIADYLRAPPGPIPPRPWGWKAPVSQVVLPELLEAFESARYIHVIRHPLDMAWSDNTHGVCLWGPLCGYDLRAVERAPHDARLAWWLYTTERVMELARVAGDRILVVGLDQLCEVPQAVTRQLASYAGLEPDEGTIEAAAGLITPPASIGRRDRQDLNVLSSELRERAEQWLAAWNAVPRVGALT